MMFIKKGVYIIMAKNYSPEIAKAVEEFFTKRGIELYPLQ